DEARSPTHRRSEGRCHAPTESARIGTAATRTAGRDRFGEAGGGQGGGTPRGRSIPCGVSALWRLTIPREHQVTIQERPSHAVTHGMRERALHRVRLNSDLGIYSLETRMSRLRIVRAARRA